METIQVKTKNGDVVQQFVIPLNQNVTLTWQEPNSQSKNTGYFSAEAGKFVFNTTRGGVETQLPTSVDMWMETWGTANNPIHYIIIGNNTAFPIIAIDSAQNGGIKKKRRRTRHKKRHKKRRKTRRKRRRKTKRKRRRKSKRKR